MQSGTLDRRRADYSFGRNDPGADSGVAGEIARRIQTRIAVDNTRPWSSRGNIHIPKVCYGPSRESQKLGLRKIRDWKQSKVPFPICCTCRWDVPLRHVVTIVSTNVLRGRFLYALLMIVIVPAAYDLIRLE